MLNCTTPAAKKLVAGWLTELGLTDCAVGRAHTVDFTDLARATCLFVDVNNWRPDARATDLERRAKAAGFRLSFRAAPGVFYVG